MEKKAAGAKKPELAAARKHNVLGHWLDLDDSVRYRSPSVTKG